MILSQHALAGVRNQLDQLGASGGEPQGLAGGDDDDDDDSNDDDEMMFKVKVILMMRGVMRMMIQGNCFQNCQYNVLN